MRPLYDDGASSATAATRDYTLTVEAEGGAPILNVFGGKITTYRRLAESALDKIKPFFPGTPGPWTAGVALPGGDFAVDGVAALIARLRADYPFLGDFWARRLIRAYGTEAWQVMGDAAAEDVVWRRNKLGLRLSKEQIKRIDTWMTERAAGAA